MLKEFIRGRFFVTLIFSFSLLIFLVISYLSYRDSQLLKQHTQQVVISNENLLAYESFISIMKDAETGQRGYLLTNDSTYLQPYHTALASIDSLMGRIRLSASPTDSMRRQNLLTISKLVRRRLFILESVLRRRMLGLDSAIATLRKNQGKRVMDSLRYEVRRLQTSERAMLVLRNQSVAKSSDQIAFTRTAGSIVSVLLLLWAFWILQQQMRKRQEALALLEQANNELELKVWERTQELQQAMVELATSNEELQATSEELTASNEEMVASNEELAIGNEQLGLLNKTLDDARQQLQLALESARMGTWRWNIRNDEIAWSEGLEAVHGLNREAFKQLYGNNFEGFQQLIHPQDRPFIKRTLLNALNEKNNYDLEFRVVRPDGEVRWILSRGRSVYDEAGQPLEMLGVGLDVTESKQAAKELYDSELRYRHLFENNPQPMWIYDTETLAFVAVNQAAIHHFGYTREEFFAKKADGLAVPEETSRVSSIVGKVKRNGSADQQYECLLQKRDGSAMTVIATSHALPDREGQKTRIVMLNDITERKSAEERLRNSEARLRRMFNSDMIGICFWQDSGRVTEANDRFLRILGYTREDLRNGSLQTGKVTQAITPDEYTARDEAANRELAKTGYFTPFEKEYFRKDGSRVPVLVGAAIMDEASGEKVAFVLDITERKLAETKLRESEAKLRRLYDSGMMGVNYWTSQGEITDSNDFFLDMVGYTREDLRAGKLNWQKLTVPGYEHLDKAAQNQVDQVGYCTPYEKKYFRKDGTIIDVLIGSALLEGCHDQGIAFLFDITERKEAEEKLRSSEKLLQTIFEASADALFLIDGETRLIEECNQQAVDLFAFGSKQAIQGKRARVLEKNPFTEEERQAIMQELVRKKHWSSEIEYVGKGGASFWGNVVISLIDVEGKPYYLIRIRDVTERHNFYEEIKRKQLELLEAKRQTDQQLAIIEADNLRKTRELEEAKEMQLSMLPQRVPQLQNLELATYMKTCVEVGGDYYDYKTHHDAHFFIIGDATGHGLKAGIIVATVKSYFQTLAGQCGVVELLQKISEGIRNLQIRAMYMGVTVIQIKGNQFTIASSGMPPLYLYRQATNDLETITLRGPFLGSSLPTPYLHVTRELEPGDALLALTDGLPELFNAAHHMLDYPAVVECYRQSAQLPAKQVLEALVKLGDDWAENRPNEDDITLLVLKAK